MQQFGLNKVRKNNAARLSGGEKRRLEIARCLVCEPLLILLDEPFTGIDPITIADIQQIVRDLCKQGIGILLTDHRVAEVLKITDRSYLIKDGRVFTHGSPDEIVNDPIAIREYLGTSFQDTIHGGRPPNGPAPNPSDTPAGSALAVPQLLKQERIHRLIEELKSDRKVAAAGELCECGRAAVPALLEALERRDVEMRTMAFATLQRILDAKAVFDPYAPEAHRKHQLAILRDEVHRKAG